MKTSGRTDHRDEIVVPEQHGQQRHESGEGIETGQSHRSDPFRDFVAKQAGRFEEQHHQYEQEGDGILVA